MRGHSIPVPRTTTSYSGAISSMVMAGQEDRIRHDIKSKRFWSMNGVLELKCCSLVAGRLSWMIGLA